MTEVIALFNEALGRRNIVPPDRIIADGHIHRCNTESAHGKNDASYLLHLDGLPSGGFENHQDGLGWENWHADNKRDISVAEKQALRSRLVTDRKARQADIQLRHEEACISSQQILNQSRPASTHPYLQKKGVRAHEGTRVANDGRFIIPMQDVNGRVCSLQFIDESGSKRFLTGGRKQECSFLIGEPHDTLCIAEGYATAATVHEASGHAVAVAFDAGNMKPVSEALHQKYPAARIIICADDDWQTQGNPGITKARQAAESVAGYIAIPVFAENRAAADTDFNNLAAREGLPAVKACIETALPVSSKPLTTTPTLLPSTEQRPCFFVLTDWLDEKPHRLRPGVYHCTTRSDQGKPAPVNSWICSPLYVEAITFDRHKSNFGRLLSFINSLGELHQWAMPMEMLRGSGEDLRGVLLSKGVELDPAKSRLLMTYLANEHPKRQVRCTPQTGWLDTSFVLPDTVIGPQAGNIIFQPTENEQSEFSTAGTLEQWRNKIAAKAHGNPLLIFALSASFAAPLLARCEVEGGGFHFFGDSSMGKTALIVAGSSVWGGEHYRRSWSTTANGIEGAAAQSNDCLLALDEISQCDPYQAKSIIYALGNGIGKQRASRSGLARPVMRWRCMVLSSGERRISTTLQEAGQYAKAGQTIRILDIPVNRTYGAWDTLHGLTPAALTDAIKHAANKCHGHAGREFLKKLTQETRSFIEQFDEIMRSPDWAVDQEYGQGIRAAIRFALTAFGGELATEYGLTGWEKGSAFKAAAELFKSWQASRGQGNDEKRQIAERLSGYIERHREGRFSSKNDTDTKLTIRAGWWIDRTNGRVYLLTAGAMQEALEGFDFDRATNDLQTMGALERPWSDGRRGKSTRIGKETMRLYYIHPEKLILYK